MTETTARTEEVLRTIAADPSLLGRFLNTLSALEYVGVRKILKSRRAETIDVDVLSHIVEEAGHALLLKKAAIEISPALTTFDENHLLAGADAVRYFQDLDHAIEAGLAIDFAGDEPRASALNYLYTTLLIEERADAFYPILARHLAGKPGSPVIPRILAEERGHRERVGGAVGRLDRKAADRIPAFRTIEEGLFDRLLTAIGKQFP